MWRQIMGWIVGMGVTLSTGAATLDELKEAARSPMTFTPITFCGGIKGCQPAVLAKGVIMGDSGDRLSAYLTTHRAQSPRMVVLDSPGGTFNMSILIGLLIRKHGLDTYVAKGTECNSGCFYVFLGGVRREVANGGALGVHVNSYLPHSPLDPNYRDHPDVYSAADVSEGAREVLAEVGVEIKYFAAMGARPETLTEIFGSFGPPVPVSVACLRYLRVDNSTPPPKENWCPGTAGVAAQVGNSTVGLSADEANAMLHGY